MPQGDVILDEQNRSKLDGIVSQMQANNESDEDIQFVVNDFKSKYGTSPKQPTSSQGAENGVSKFIAPQQSGGSTSVPTSTQSAFGETVKQIGKPQPTEPKLKAEQIRTLKSFAFNKQQAQKNAEVVQPINREVSSTTEDLYNSFAAGSAKLGSMISKTPAFLYDLAAVPQNLVAKYTGLNTGVSAKEFAEKYNLPENEVAQYYDEAYKNAKVNIDAKYDKSITDYIANGEYAKATKQIANQVLESAPVSISLMMGNAGGLTTMESTLGGGVVFGADKKSELDQNNPQMTEADKTLSAAGNGLLEGVFEQFGITKLGAIGKDIIAKEGVEASKEAIENTFKEVYAPVLKKYIGIGFEEPLGEAATQFAQNVITKYGGENPDIDLTEGVADAAIVGFGSSVVFSSPVAAIDLIKGKDARSKAKDLQTQKKAIENDLANPTVPNEVKNILSEQSKNINASLADLHIVDNVETSNLSEELKQQIIENNKTIDNLESAISDMSISEDSRKIIENKKKDLENQNEKILNANKISEPIKFTSPTNDKYGYVEENGVKRDLTKDEFENYAKVDMEQQVGAATTEEPKGVGENTKENEEVNNTQNETDNIQSNGAVYEPPTTEEGIKSEESRIASEEAKSGIRSGVEKISDIEVRPDVFQFKAQDEESGVNLAEKLQGNYDKNLAGTIGVWKDEKGELGEKGKVYVVDGHHRMEFAKRNGEKDMNVFYIDAPTAKDARVIGAKANIAQGRGTSIDAAKVYKEATPEQLEGFKPTSKVAREGMELAKLEDSVFNLVVQNKLDIPTAMAIAKVEKPKQESFYKAIKRIEDSGAIKMTPKGLSVMADKISNGDVAVNKVQEMDLFGTTEQEELLLAEQSQLESDIKDELAKDAKILGSANKNKSVLEKAKNVVNEEVNAKLAEQSRLASGLFDTYKNRKEVSEIIKQATIDLSKATNRKQRAEIKEKATNDVKKAIETQLENDFNGSKIKEKELQTPNTKETPQAETSKAEPKVESTPEKVQESKVEQEYQEAISKKSERAKNNAKEKFINNNFDTIVSQLMLKNKIKRKC